MTRASMWLALGAVIAIAAPVQAAAKGAACGRECLGGLLDRYLVALAAHDPGRAPLDFTFRQTQNAVVIPQGDGLWRDAASFGLAQRRYFDPVTSTAAW